jgi:hypothetical protein
MLLALSSADVYGIVILGFLLVVAVAVWVGFIGWVRRKGWRDARERIEEGPREG